MSPQAEVSNKARICAALISELMDLQARYEHLFANHGELARHAGELNRQRKELKQRTREVDELFTEARVRYDAVFATLQDPAKYLPFTGQEQ